MGSTWQVMDGKRLGWGELSKEQDEGVRLHHRVVSPCELGSCMKREDPSEGSPPVPDSGFEVEPDAEASGCSSRPPAELTDVGPDSFQYAPFRLSHTTSDSSHESHGLLAREATFSRF
jgi:hypothetical protein